MNKTIVIYIYSILLLMWYSVSAIDSTDTANSAQGLHAKISDNPEIPEINTMDREKQDDVVVAKETKDTVYMLGKPGEKKEDATFKGKVDNISNRDYGFAGGPFYGISALNVKPIEKLCDLDPFLRNRTFSFSKYHYEPVILSGGMGFAGIGNGMRIGGGGMHGSKKFTSAPFNGDSVVTLEVTASYGGFIFEKVFKYNKWNIKGGGLIGGGSLKVSIRNSNSVFSADYLDEDVNKTKAGFFCLNPYGGCSYSFFPIFHLGIDISIPVFISTEGFSSASGDFYTVNPGVILKFIFGNLG